MAKYKNRDVTIVEVTPEVEYPNTVTVIHADGSRESVKKSEVLVTLAEAARLRNDTLGGSDPMLLPPEERPIEEKGPTIAEISAKEAADEREAHRKAVADKKYSFLNPSVKAK
jgi:hypothetical protein